MSSTEPRERLNVHICPGSFRFASRILKETATAVASGGIDQIFILARWEEGLAEVETIDDHRTVIRIRTPLGSRLPGPIGGLVRLLEWQTRAGAWLIRRRPLVVNPHSLPVLPLALVIRLLRRSRLVYDTHELETQSVNSSGVRRVVGRMIEKVGIPMCSAVVVVNQSIGDWYQTRHPQARVIVVRNVPHRSAQPPEPSDHLRSHFEIPDDHLIFLYQGSISRGRSVDTLLQVFADLPVDRHLVFLGYGELEGLARDGATRLPNVHFHEAVPPADLLPITAGADVGLCIIEDACLSYFLSLPNKLFEYVSAGLPAVISDFPEMRRLVDDLGVGWPVDVTESDISATLGTISLEDVAERRAAALAGRSSLDWETESAPLVSLYQELGAKKDR